MDMVSVLFGLCGLLLGTVGTILTLSKLYVSKEDCNKTIENCDRMKKYLAAMEKEKFDVIQRTLDCIKIQNELQFQMIRAIIANMDNLTSADKERILNMRGIK
jgi:hypothetical protein